MSTQIIFKNYCLKKSSCKMNESFKTNIKGIIVLIDSCKSVLDVVYTYPAMICYHLKLSVHKLKAVGGLT